MNKIIFIATAALSTFGCMKDRSPINNGNLVEWECVAELNEPTRTSVDKTGKINWTKNDIICYYSAPAGTIHKHSIPEDCHSTSFKATVGSEDSFIIAAYGGQVSEPQDNSMTLTGAVNGIQSGKFKDAHISVCKRLFENGNTLKFKSITSLIQFSLNRNDVSYIVFTTNDRTKIHGNGNLYFTFSGESISSVKFGDGEGGNSIRVNTDGAGTFYISTLPCSITDFTLSCFDRNGTEVWTGGASTTLNLSEGKIINLGTLDDIGVKTVSLNYSQKTIYMDSSFKLIPIITPTFAKVHSILWSSSNEDIAEVSETGLVTAKAPGSCNIKVTVNGTATATCSTKVDDVFDLSTNGTANCYIASKRGAKYKFKATKGNSTEISTFYSVEVLWESFGTTTTPQVGDVISSVSLENGYIKFTAGQNGNAVIFATDGGYNHWSWHIWVCQGFHPEVSQQIYNNDAGTMMNRNLGAKSADGKDGLIYQWGRKDPFLGSSSTSLMKSPASTLQKWPSTESSGVGQRIVEYSIRNPTTYINNSNTEPYDWLLNEADNFLWNTSDNKKTIYDPCPAGWRVPCGGTNGIWTQAFGGISEFSESGYADGFDFGQTTHKLIGSGSDHCVYPATGILTRFGKYYFDNSGYYWSCTPNDGRASVFYFKYTGTVNTSHSEYRATAMPIRCVKE